MWQDFIDRLKYVFTGNKPDKISCRLCEKESYSIIIMVLHLALKHKRYHLPNYNVIVYSVEYRVVKFVFDVFLVAIKALLLPFAMLYEIL